jgi:hypothetical protein
MPSAKREGSASATQPRSPRRAVSMIGDEMARVPFVPLPGFQGIGRRTYIPVRGRLGSATSTTELVGDAVMGLTDSAVADRPAARLARPGRAGLKPS